MIDVFIEIWMKAFTVIKCRILSIFNDEIEYLKEIYMRCNKVIRNNWEETSFFVGDVHLIITFAVLNF